MYTYIITLFDNVYMVACISCTHKLYIFERHLMMHHIHKEWNIYQFLYNKGMHQLAANYVNHCHVSSTKKLNEYFLMKHTTDSALVFNNIFVRISISIGLVFGPAVQVPFFWVYLSQKDTWAHTCTMCKTDCVNTSNVRLGGGWMAVKRLNTYSWYPNKLHAKHFIWIHN